MERRPTRAGAGIGALEQSNPPSTDRGGTITGGWSDEDSLSKNIPSCSRNLGIERSAPSLQGVSLLASGNRAGLKRIQRRFDHRGWRAETLPLSPRWIGGDRTNRWPYAS